MTKERPREPVKRTIPNVPGEISLESECKGLPQRADTSFNRAIGYEIFVRSFRDSDGDGIGDFQGLVEKLDYLNDGDPDTDEDLEVDLVWLMPVTPSPSYHGYDVTDYLGVRPEYGTMEQFSKLLDEAHARGIRVITDLVLNHTSSAHPWFLESAKEGAVRRDWFVWSPEKLDWPRPWGDKGPTWHQKGKEWYYGLFSPSMPDLNYRSNAVREEMKGVAEFWLDDVGIDGFRLDAVRYIVETGPNEGVQDTAETLQWWREFCMFVRARHPDALLVGEVWASNSIASAYHLEGEGMQLTFDFDLMESMVAGVLSEDATDIERTLCSFASQFPVGAGDATFLSNHDLPRLATRLMEDPALIRLAAMMLFVLPGTPFIYYGQEIGMINGPTSDDKQKRLPMRWNPSPAGGFTTGKPWAVGPMRPGISVAEQTKDPDSLLSLYRKLIRLRRNNSALSLGGFFLTKAGSATVSNLWAFLRPHQHQTAAVVVNLTGTSALEVWVEILAKPAQEWRLLYPRTSSVLLHGNRLELGDVPAHSVAIAVAPPHR